MSVVEINSKGFKKQNLALDSLISLGTLSKLSIFFMSSRMALLPYASRPSEHPPFRGEKTFRWGHGLQRPLFCSV